jgi:hypothetical protein
MKKTLLTLMLALATPFFVEVSAQESVTHFDNKPYVEGEFLVQLKADKSLKDVLNRMPEQYDVKFGRLLSKPMRIWLITFDHQAISHSNFQSLLYSQPEVSIADYNYKIDMRATIPNDADFSDQWHHVNTGQTGGTADADIDSDLAWDITTGGQTATNDDIVVCVIESGNLDHIDLSPNRWFNANEIPNNGIDDDNNGYIDDYDGWNPVAGNDNYGTGGHGTNCLGMIGAKGNNNSLVVGANWDVKLMVVGDYSISTQANAIEAYTYPLEMRQLWNNSNGSEGAFVVATSSSWGIDGADPTNYPLWCNFYDTLGKYGVLNVGATTNSNLNVDTQGDMPTACGSNYMIGVGRTDHNDNTAGGYGATTIEFGAPGINVVTTANTNTTTTTTGTSFSCPLTAGVIGLAYSIPCPSFMAIVKANPQQGADLVLQALLSGTDPKAALANKFVTGGRLNAKNTLDELMTATCSGSICLAPSGITTSNIAGTTADVNWNPYDSATQYVFYYQEAGTGSWTSTNVTGTSYNFTGLMPCTSYEYYLQSICTSDSSSTTSVQSFTTTGCGNCVDLSYCTNSATDAVDEWIESVEIDTWTSTTGNDNGYGDYTNGGAASLSMDLGQTYNVTLTPDWGGTTYDEYFRVWIDLDQSGDFDASELVYDQGAAAQTAATGTISIPSTATPGSTRMRVQMAYLGTGQNTLPSECGTFQWGEVEDYCVDLVQSVICGMTVTNTIQDPTCSDLDNGSIAVSVAGGATPYSYDWGTLGTSSSVTGLGDGSYQLVITDGSGCDTTISYQLDYTTVMDVSVTTTDASCNGTTDGSLTATATGSTGYTYAWSNSVTTATNSNVAAGTYSVTVTDTDGCTAVANGTVNEPAPVNAAFTANESGMIVNFTNNSSTGTYLWDFGDGNTSTATDPVHTYGDEGTFTVCLTVTNSCGTDSTCTTVVSADASGIDDNEVMLFGFYPNPASDELTITEVSPEVVNIEVVDAMGRLLESYRVNNTTFDINVSRMSSGSYFFIPRDELGNSLGTYKFNVIR